MRIVCLTHVSFEGPGGIADWAAARGHSFELAAVYDSSAPHTGEFDMLVVMGGPMSIHDEAEHPWLLSEKRFIRAAIDSGKSVLGVCLGAQLLAASLGAEVRPGPEPEIGWFPVRLTESGQTSKVASVLPREFDAIHWHGDTFGVPPGAIHLAESELTESQAFEFEGGRVVGLQFHLELSREDLKVLIENASQDLERAGRWVSTAERMLAGPERFAKARERLFAMLDAMATSSAYGSGPVN